MPVDQFKQGQQNFAEDGRLNDRGSYKAALMPGYIQQLMAGRMSRVDAVTAANDAVVLHNPDQVWGNSAADALGNSNVNSSIGGGASSRVAEYKNYLDQAKPPGNSTPNVKLCAELDGQEVC